MRWFWIDGRFSWAFVSAVLFVTLSLLCADFAWRILIVPFESFLLLTIVVDGVLAVILVAAYRLWRARRIDFSRGHGA